MRSFASVILFLQLVLPAIVLPAAQDRPGAAAALATERARLMRDFDVRAKIRNAHRAGGAEKTLNDRARAAAEASGLRASASSSLRVAEGRFGAPRLVSSADGPLTAASREDPETIARDFLRAWRGLFSFSGDEIDALKVTERDVSDGIAFLKFQQTVSGVDVFQGFLKIVVDREGRVAQAMAADIAPGLRLAIRARLSPREAAAAALEAGGWKNAGLQQLSSAGPMAAVFRNPRGAQLLPLAVDPVVFPLTASNARLAYRMIVDGGGKDCFETVVDARTGGVLYRKSLVRFAAKGRVWKDSPVKGARELVDFPDDWLPADGAVTTGNNADAYLDTDGDNAPDTQVLPDIKNGRASSPSRVFDFPAGEGSTGQDPAEFPAAAVTNAFYFANQAHDYFYRLGFTELSGNFQTDNFGRGGKGNDAVRVQVQDGDWVSGFTATPDGMAPRLHLGIDSHGTYQYDDDRDAAYSAHMVFHEYTHGVTSRILGGQGCLSGFHSYALDEGWGDYFAVSYTNDPVFGAYMSGDKIRGGRRFGYDRYLFTYEDLGNEGFDVYRDGEIWAAALWDLRKELGQKVADQLVMDGLKFTPCRANMIEARDAIMRADQTKYSGEHRAKLWEVFARHGMGYSADGYDGVFYEVSTVFTAAYDLPPELGPGNRWPKVTGRPTAVPGLGDAYSYKIQATDPDGDPLLYELLDGPAGMTVDQSGLVKWTAGFIEERAAIAVSDGRGGKAIHGFSIPSITALTVGQPITIGAPENSYGFAEVTVPAGTPILQVTLRGGIGNPDLFALSPSNDFHLSMESGATETISVPLPTAGLWTIAVFGASTYSATTLQASLPAPKLIEPNAAVEISGEATSQSFYRVVAPAGIAAFTVATSGGTGDLDLYLRKNSPAVCDWYMDLFGQCAYDRASRGMDNVEFIQVANPSAGDWYIAVTAERAYSGARLRTITTPAGQTAPKPPPSGRTLASGTGQSFVAASVTEPRLLTSPTFRIEVPEGAQGLTVRLNTSTEGADVDLYLRYETSVAIETGKIVADHASEKAGTGNETIVVTSSSVPPLRAGWYAVALRLVTTGVTVSGTLTATLGAPSAGPRITPGGVILATGTPVVSALAPNAIFTIFGESLAPDGVSELNPKLGEDQRIATSLGGTCVEFNGVRAPLFAVLSTQINGQVPHGIAAGQASVVVIGGCGTAAETRSAAETVTVAAAAPGFFHFINNAAGRNPIAALHGGGPELAGATGLIPGANCSPAAKDEYVSLFATGLGRTAPALEAGQVPELALLETGGLARVAGEIHVSIGGIALAPEDIYYAGIAPCCAGLYQLVVRVPSDAAAGDLPVRVTIDGASSPEGSYLTVQAAP
ncbi:MAG: M36 family metallopeptidase [Bryobacteraceae bacterium]|nr:M36 family metallopeptidase [Bryobacteraceae bacterium]